MHDVVLLAILLKFLRCELRTVIRLQKHGETMSTEYFVQAVDHLSCCGGLYYNNFIIAAVVVSHHKQVMTGRKWTH